MEWLKGVTEELSQAKKLLEQVVKESNEYEYLTAKEITEKYQISRRTIYTLKTSGTLECVKIGKREKYKIFKGGRSII